MRFLTGSLILLANIALVHAQDGLSVLTDSQNPEDCKEVESIIPTCLFSRQRANTSVELITNDVKVCNCLGKSNGLFDKSEPAVQTQMSKVERERKRLIENESRKTANASVIQASTHSKDEREQDIALLSFGAGEIRGQLKKDKPASNASTPVISSKLTTINDILEENKSWQCVTYQEYGLQRELPNDNDFFQILRGQEFKPEEWNINTLKDKFETANEEQKKAIRLKMVFLSRNPIFQSIMKAEVSEKFPAAKILEKQTELFGILRTLSPSEASSCFLSPNGCFQEVMSNGKYQEYSQKVGHFIAQNDVIDISSAQAAMDYQRELEKITSDGEVLVNSVPTDPEGYFNYLQTANREVFNECSGAEVKPDCYTKFKDHCSHITAIDARVKKGMKLNILDISAILREEASVFMNMNPAENADFRAFNDKICLDPYANSSGEKLNYFQFKAKHCGESPKPFCSDRKKILDTFLKDYNVGEVVADNNLRSGFQRMIADKTFQAISEAQVLAANNISESPSELRARFGGNFPDITPKGTIVPFVAPQNLARSGSSQTSFEPAGDSSADFSSSQSTSKRNESSRSSFSDAGTTSNIARNPYLAPLSDLAVPTLPLPQRNRPDVSNLPAFRKPAAINTDESTIEEAENSISSNRPAPRIASSSNADGFGGGSVGGSVSASASVSGSSPGSLVGPTGGGSLGGGVTSVTVGSPSRSERRAGNGLLFKYGLDERNQPEVSLVSATTGSEVQVSVDKNLMARIRSNPNSLEIGQEDLEKIMATPDEEVKLLIQPNGGAEALVVYAKKDSTGGVSFSLNPSKTTKAPKDVLRINVQPDVHANITKDPDIYLNQSAELMQEVMGKEGKDKKLFLQVVSPGKRAVIYEVIKKSEYIYKFKKVGP